MIIIITIGKVQMSIFQISSNIVYPDIIIFNANINITMNIHCVSRLFRFIVFRYSNKRSE